METTIESLIVLLHLQLHESTATRFVFIHLQLDRTQVAKFNHSHCCYRQIYRVRYMKCTSQAGKIKKDFLYTTQPQQQDTKGNPVKTGQDRQY